MRIRKFSRSPKGCLRVVHFSECPPARKSTFHALADAVSRATQAEAAARYFFEITRQPVGLNASGDSFTRLEWFLLPRVTRVLFQSFQPLVFSTPKCPLFSIDRSSFPPSTKVIEGNRSLVLQLGKYIPCDLYRETCGKVSRYSKICSPLPTTAGTIIIFYTFCESEKVFIPYLYPQELMNKTHKDDSFFFFTYIYIYIFNARVAIPSKGYKVFLNRVPRLFFAKKKKEKIIIRQVVSRVKLQPLGKYIFPPLNAYIFRSMSRLPSKFA